VRCCAASQSATMPVGMADEKQIEREDRDLIGRMASRDPMALDAFYARYNRLAFSLIFRILGSREDAEDVVVDVFWQGWQQAGRYDSSRGKPIAWLLTIARTRAIDSLRSSGRKNLSSDSPEHHPERINSPVEADAFVLADTRRAVREALDSLPEQHRAPL